MLKLSRLGRRPATAPCRSKPVDPLAAAGPIRAWLWVATNSSLDAVSSCSSAVRQMISYQAIVWIDLSEARILRFAGFPQHESTILAHPNSGRGPAEGQEIPERAAYFERVSRALDLADEILIVGPSPLKTEFAEYLRTDAHAIDPRVLGVETISQPDDPRLSGFARLYFATGRPRRPGNGSGSRGSG